MLNRILVLAVCVSASFLLNEQCATAQQPKSLPANPATANPVDPDLFNAPPAFGDSAPVEKTSDDLPAPDLAPAESSGATDREWKPRLRVELMTRARSLDSPAPFQRNEKPVFFDLDDSVDSVPPPGAVKRTTNKMTVPIQSFTILMCDEVTVDAKASENGDLAYSFSCNGKVILKIDDYTVTGDSISSEEGKLTIINAVIKSSMATLTAEKIQIQLPVLGVRVEPDSAEPNVSRDPLKPIPDPVSQPQIFPPSASLQRR